MPDRDVFDRSVRRGWRTAARRMLGGGDPRDSLRSVLLALGNDVKRHGCPSLDGIVGILAEAITSEDPTRARRRALDRLDLLRLSKGNRATENATSSGRRLLASMHNERDLAIATKDDGDLHLRIATFVLADLAVAEMCPAALLGELVEQGDVSFQELETRRIRARQTIASSPETRSLATQLLADPSGASVKLPRISRARMSQSDLLAAPLTT